MKPKLTLLLLLGALTLLSCVIYYVRLWGSRAMDEYQRPWAYSSDAEAKLLVGKWRGTFTDPGGVEKTLELEIDPPTTEEEREQAASRRIRRSRVRSGSSKHSFDGMATIQSKLGTESYGIHGSVDAGDFHALTFRLSDDELPSRPLPNFSAREVISARWESDKLTGKMNFNKLDAQGHSSETSEGVVENGVLVWKDDPATAPILIELSRQP
jgi:hypothetical protein